MLLLLFTDHINFKKVEHFLLKINYTHFSFNIDRIILYRSFSYYANDVADNNEHIIIPIILYAYIPTYSQCEKYYNLRLLFVHCECVQVLKCKRLFHIQYIIAMITCTAIEPNPLGRRCSSSCLFLPTPRGCRSALVINTRTTRQVVI